MKALLGSLGSLGRSSGSERSSGRPVSTVMPRGAAKVDVQGAGADPISLESKAEELGRGEESLKKRITRQFKSTKELLEERHRSQRLRKSTSKQVAPASLTAASRAAEAKSSGRRYPNMLSPTDPKRLHWDALTLVLLIYISLATPYRLGFEVEATGFFTVVEWFVDIFFMLDVVLNFRTGFIAEDGHEELEPGAVAAHYLRGWFWVDVISSVPTELVADGLSGAQVLKAGKLVRIFRVLRLVKFTRFAKVAELLEERFADAYMLLSSSTMKILKLTGITFVVAHLMACLWALLGRTADGHSWLDEYGIADSSPGQQYLASLYWAVATMTSVGYGDAFAQNDEERMLSIAVMAVGGGLYGYIIATMSSLVSRLDANERLVNEKMESLRSYMRKRNFPRELANRIRKYFKHYYETKTALDETVILSELSTYLQQEVALFLISDLIFDVPVFHDLHPSHLAKLLTVLKPVQCAPMDYLCEQGEEAHDMYIVMVGELEVLGGEGEVLKTLVRGDYFGELAVLGISSHRNASVRAVEFSELYCLNKTDLATAFKDAPDAVQRMRDASVATYEKVHQYKRDIDSSKVGAREITLDTLGQTLHEVDTRVDSLAAQLTTVIASQRTLEQGMEEILSLLQS